MVSMKGQQINRARGRTTSKYRGVGWYRRSQRWQASIWYNGKLHHLGYFDEEIDAAKAFDAAARDVYGPLAVVNFPHTQKITSPAPRRPVEVAPKNRVKRRFPRKVRPQAATRSNMRYEQPIAGDD